MGLALAVDLATVADTHNKDDQHLVMHFVDDPVVADTQSVRIFPLELLDTRRARIAEQSVYGRSEAFLNVLRQVAELSIRSCGKFESIGSGRD